MKIRVYIVTTCLLGGIFGFTLMGFSHANDKVQCTPGTWKCYGDSTNPMNVLDDLIENDDSDIIETELDKVDRRDTDQFTDPKLKFSGTLDSVRGNMSIYLQWMVFIGLVFAVILIIYNGLMLMFSPMSPDQAGKVKTRLIALVAGVILLTGFIFVLKILISIYVDVFVD